MAIQPGVKIASHGATGTLGLIVTRPNDTSRLFILSCWHVLDDGHKSGIVTLPELNNTAIAKYTRSSSTASRRLDAAIAEILPNVNLPVSNTIYGQERVITKFAAARKPMNLIKVGATTGQTRSKIYKVTGNFGRLHRGIRLGKHPDGDDDYCRPGDSGSMWCYEPTGHAVAIHAQGGFPDNTASASRLKYILRRLNIKIYNPDNL